MKIDLSDWELETIVDDSIAFLESNHICNFGDCGEMKDCPTEHFDLCEGSGGGALEVTRRQDLIRKLENGETETE